MTFRFVDLGIPGPSPQLLVLSDGVPYGIQNDQGITPFGGVPFTVGQLPGVTDGSVATAGNVGELLTNATTPTSGQVAFATSATKTIVTLALTAGCWDVHATACLHSAGGAAVPSDATFGVSGTNNTLPAANTCTADVYGIALSVDVAEPVRLQRFNLSAPATVYLVGTVNITSGTDIVAYGSMRATRIR